MPFATLIERVDRVAGGRRAAYEISEADRRDPAIRRAWRTVTVLLVVCLVLATAAVGEALVLHLRGNDASRIVWMRLVVILGMTVSLFYFRWRAGLGRWWAYSRLRLFSMIFPVVAVVSSAVPGLYPTWMIVEQVTFSIVLLAITVVLGRAPMRRAYAKPPKPQR